jgi:hypothetical protein
MRGESISNNLFSFTFLHHATDAFCFVTLFSLQEIELNKAQWSALFEPYLFFEAYKNYLQVDIVAAVAADLLAWKGWVESRLRQLTLKVHVLPLYSCCKLTSLSFWLCFLT